jgi:hypothetical protein
VHLVIDSQKQVSLPNDMQLTFTAPGALSARLPAYAGFPAFANGKSESFSEHFETAPGSNISFESLKRCRFCR